MLKIIWSYKRKKGIKSYVEIALILSLLFVVSLLEYKNSGTKSKR